MRIKPILRLFVKENNKEENNKPNQEPQKRSPLAGRYVDTISKIGGEDLYNVDLDITLGSKGPKQVPTDSGCTQTQTCSTCSGCTQTDSGCYQTQRGC